MCCFSILVIINQHKGNDFSNIKLLFYRARGQRSPMDLIPPNQAVLLSRSSRGRPVFPIIWVIGRTQFLWVMGLRSLFSYGCQIRAVSQLLEATVILGSEPTSSIFKASSLGQVPLRMNLFFLFPSLKQQERMSTLLRTLVSKSSPPGKFRVLPQLPGPHLDSYLQRPPCQVRWHNLKFRGLGVENGGGGWCPLFCLLQIINVIQGKTF